MRKKAEKEAAFQDICFTKFSSFLLTLTKVRGPNTLKGCRKDGQLWIEFASLQIMESKQFQKKDWHESFTSVVEFTKAHINKCLKALKLTEQDEKLSDEKKLKIKDAYKKHVAFKQLFFHLLVLLLEPERPENDKTTAKRVTRQETV